MILVPACRQAGLFCRGDRFVGAIAGILPDVIAHSGWSRAGRRIPDSPLRIVVIGKRNLS